MKILLLWSRQRVLCLKSTMPIIVSFFAFSILGSFSVIAEQPVRVPSPINSHPVVTPTPENRGAREKEIEDAKRLRRESEIQNLVLSAKTLPPEISADILITILESKLLTDRERRIDLISEIFQIATEVKEPVKLKLHVGLADTRSGYRSMAYELNLDKLSVQLRSVRLMLALDKAKARNLFRDIPAPKLDPLSCQDDLDYEMSEYYAVLKDIFEKTFDEESKRRYEHVYLAASYIDSMNSPAQVGPVIDFLTSVKANPEEFRPLLDSFSLTLRKVSDDPRSFASSMLFRGVTKKIAFSLLPKSGSHRVQTDNLLKSYRAYLVKNLSATQCADTKMVSTSERPDPVISAANGIFASPISSDESKPERIEPGAKTYSYWGSPKASKLLVGIKNLRFAEGKTELTKTERSHPLWQEKFLRFIDEMDSWKAEDEDTTLDYLHQKCVLYNGLFELAPNDTFRAMVLRNYALFLRDSSLQKESPSQWLYYTKLLLRMGRTLKGSEYAMFLDEVRRAGNEPLTLYTEIDRLKSVVPPKS